MSNTQISCGSLQAKMMPDNTRLFSGTVRLIGRLNGKIELLVNPYAAASKSDNHPDFEVLYQPAGEATAFRVGSAWIKQGDRVGEFLSITMAHPDWASDLNLWAFPPNPQRGETSWRVLWSRPRGARVQDQEQDAA